MREEQGEDKVVLVGFGSYEGSVVAGSAWDAPMRVMPVPRAPSHAWEAAFHETGLAQALVLSDETRGIPAFSQERAHRAIGVVYHPERERAGTSVIILTDTNDLHCDPNCL